MVDKNCISEPISPSGLGLISKTDYDKREALKKATVLPIYIRMKVSHLDLLDDKDHEKLIKIANQAEARAKWLLSGIDLSSNLGQKILAENQNVLKISDSYARAFIRSYEKYCS